MIWLSLSLSISSASAGSGGGVRGFPLSKAVRIAIIGDSQGAGRGTGTGALNMDGARKLSWPYQLMLRLRDIGFEACDNSFFESNNADGTWGLYDPRVSSASWTYGNATLGGRLLQASTNGLGTPEFTPDDDVDTFEVLNLQHSTGATANWSIREKGGSIDLTSGTIAQGNATAAALKTVATVSLGQRTFRFARAAASAAGTTAYLTGVIAYDSTRKAAQMLNLSARGWSTIDWLNSNSLWRGYDILPSLLADVAIISLGTNDRRSGGAGLTAATFKTNMQTLINRTKVTASQIILMMPMPINQASIGTFSDAELLQVYQELATANDLPLIRTDLLLGDWASANARGEVSDSLHWRAAASEKVAQATVSAIQNSLKVWAA